MLGKYLIVDKEQWPNPVAGTLTQMLNAAENVYDTEDGGQVVNVIRLDRPSWTATFNCTSAMRDKILEKCRQASCSVEIAGQEMEGRLRLSANYTLVANSERTKRTNGLWVVPVIFEGF